MYSKEISMKYNSEKNNISKYPIDRRFAESHWELKEKYDNICKIAEKIALEEFKNTRFQYATHSHMDFTNNNGIIVTLYKSEYIPCEKFIPDNAKVTISWDVLDKILNVNNNTGINITVEPHLQNGKPKYVINNTISLEEAIKFTSNENNITENVDKNLLCGIKLSLEKADDYFSVTHEGDIMKTFMKCGITIERSDNIVSSSGFLTLMKNETLENLDEIYFLEFGVLIVSPTRNKIIIL